MPRVGEGMNEHKILAMNRAVNYCHYVSDFHCSLCDRVT
jgi:hypothetical protein